VASGFAGGEIWAAIAKVRESIEELRRAQAAGASVAPLIALLEQIVLALSAVVWLKQASRRTAEHFSSSDRHGWLHGRMRRPCMD
jgi:hypothetical protein